MHNVAVVGKNSYLAQHFLATETGRNAQAVTHDAIGNISFSEIECIVNFAYPPAYMSDPYDPSNDVERSIVDRIKGTDIHIVMISSRKVYDMSHPCPWYETSPLAGQGVYGRNKIISEDYVRENRASRHTILRVGNIIEAEPGRYTFMGKALQTLKEDGRITLDIGPGTKRDFLPLGNFVAALAKTVEAGPVGTYNLASGLETAVGDVASWIVEGFGAGDVVSTADAYKDEFVLDVSRLVNLIGPVCSREDIRQACTESGKMLRDG